MSPTPARDALVALAAEHLPLSYISSMRWAINVVLANPDAVLAALVEAGWTPTDDELGLLGGLHIDSGSEGETWRFPAAPDAGGAPT